MFTNVWRTSSASPAIILPGFSCMLKWFLNKNFLIYILIFSWGLCLHLKKNIPQSFVHLWCSTLYLCCVFIQRTDIGPNARHSVTIWIKMRTNKQMLIMFEMFSLSIESFYPCFCGVFCNYFYFISYTTANKHIPIQISIKCLCIFFNINYCFYNF